jgi:hypothetical protein
MNDRVLAAMEWSKVSPSSGDLRVWWNTGYKQNFYQVGDITQAILVLGRLADQQVNDDTIPFNAGGLEEYDSETGEWYEWTDTDGRDIYEHWEEE